jgi:hypothetical protein
MLAAVDRSAEGLSPFGRPNRRSEMLDIHGFATLNSLEVVIAAEEIGLPSSFPSTYVAASRGAELSRR